MSYALRKRNIVADDGLIDVQIQVKVGVRDRRLTRDEHDDLIEAITSSIMPLLPNQRYVRVPLSKVRVTR